MEQIIKTYIGMFFLIATVAIGINFIYASLVSRNANNLANNYAAKIRASNMSAKVIDACQEEIASSGGEYKKLNVDIISDKDNKNSGTMTLEYSYRLPVFGIDSTKKVVRNI
ncbi:MAG TPA: hypothetical protein DCR12_04385 [Lachnospiraceae bacterium]|nr:hypothetical protein [Lachnospiraceae bacterium]